MKLPGGGGGFFSSLFVRGSFVRFFSGLVVDSRRELYTMYTIYV